MVGMAKKSSLHLSWQCRRKLHLYVMKRMFCIYSLTHARGFHDTCLVVSVLEDWLSFSSMILFLELVYTWYLTRLRGLAEWSGRIAVYVFWQKTTHPKVSYFAQGHSFTSLFLKRYCRNCSNMTLDILSLTIYPFSNIWRYWINPL